MKILIIRMFPDVLNIKNYNCQEIGLAKALIRKGNICDIVLYTNKENYEDDIFFDNNKKIHIYHLKARSFLKNAFFDKKLYEIVNKYDIVQSAEYDQIANVKLKRKLGNKLIIYHGPYKSKYTKGYNLKCLISDFYYFFHKEYKNTPCISKSELATKFLKSKGFKNVSTIGVGLDEERFKQETVINQEIKKLIEEKEKNNFKYLLYIGKLEKRRNIPCLIDVLEKIDNTNVKLIIIGKGEKEYVKKCSEYAKNKNISNRIIYYESMKQTDLPNIYKCCDIFLLPTQYEIFGMVLLEAMYFGVPTITTWNGGSSTLIENEQNGFICSIQNQMEWINTIEKLLNNESIRLNVSKNSQEKIKENYTWDSLSEVFISEYKKI